MGVVRTAVERIGMYGPDGERAARRRWLGRLDERDVEPGARRYDQDAQIQDTLGVRTFGEAQLEKATFARALRLGLGGDPRIGRDGWIELKVPAGDWRVAGQVGVDLRSPQAKAVVDVRVVASTEELWRGRIEGTQQAEIPRSVMPAGERMGRVEVVLAENPRQISVCFGDLRLVPA